MRERAAGLGAGIAAVLAVLAAVGDRGAIVLLGAIFVVLFARFVVATRLPVKLSARSEGQIALGSVTLQSAGASRGGGGGAAVVPGHRR